ncbi:MAG: DUF2975 domain-containing protein [Methylocella sp.]
MTDAAALLDSHQTVALRGRIGWICHGVRVAAVVYPVWILWLLAAYWSDPAQVAAGYGHLLKADLSGIALWQEGAAFAVDFVVWLFTAGACYAGWRLFSTYLRGRIFTLDAALWLRRLALLGVMAQLIAILTRPLISIIVTLHLPQGHRVVNIFLQPGDLLTLLLLAILLALAHIFKTAAEIAGEHSQFV